MAFEKYIDSILDLLLPPLSPGIKDPIVDLHGQPEILFMGPDENTADLVDWATEHARARGAPWWKSFFTGKSPRLGGIPHDKYGMTTLSVREFVLGIYRKLHLNPANVRKLQTGGPDGDLGSNEILLGNEKYVSIVDGAGVVVDPNGLDHDELLRLARKRVMISEYDLSKLSPEGYRVLVEDSDVQLPTGEVVHNGMIFRNTFHLRGHPKYDVFVPCGGRPESIDLGTVGKLISDGKSVVPYIVEGANLFITQDAKLRLEKAGAILFKDASANKGGVTSSSLEVLASLSFDDAGFEENMCVRADGTEPEFYTQYVREVQETIRKNARLEFEAIWREHQQTGLPRSTLSDTLSVAITSLDEELQKSDLWQKEDFRRSVLTDALPNLLLEQIGLDLILERVRGAFAISMNVRARLCADGRNRCRTTIYDPSLAASWRVDSCTSTETTRPTLRSSTCKFKAREWRVFRDVATSLTAFSMSKRMSKLYNRQSSPEPESRLLASVSGGIDDDDDDSGKNATAPQQTVTSSQDADASVVAADSHPDAGAAQHGSSDGLAQAFKTGSPAATVDVSPSSQPNGVRLEQSGEAAAGSTSVNAGHDASTVSDPAEHFGSSVHVTPSLDEKSILDQHTVNGLNGHVLLAKLNGVKDHPQNNVPRGPTDSEIANAGEAEYGLGTPGGGTDMSALASSLDDAVRPPRHMSPLSHHPTQEVAEKPTAKADESLFSLPSSTPTTRPSASA